MGDLTEFWTGYYNRRGTEETFWSNVNKNGPLLPHVANLGPCWLWTGRVSPTSGYGEYAGTNAHRFIMQTLLNWRVPIRTLVCHRCDNRSCVRPNHLFLGNHSINALDMVAKGRQGTKVNAVRGSRHHQAKLTEDDVRAIRTAVGKGWSQISQARQYGVTNTLISNIVRRRIWAHVD